MGAVQYASRIIDVCAGSSVVVDYDLEVFENIVVRARIDLEAGFVDVYRNFATDKEAFAWIRDDRRVLGADNTGGWHRHPLDDPERHLPSDPVTLEEFIAEVEKAVMGD